jgi:hypothetical protein
MAAGVAVVALAAVAAVLLSGGSGGPHAGHHASQGRAARTVRGAASARSPVTRRGRPVQHGASITPPGELPQIRAFPSARSAQFKHEMASLWSGVRTDSPGVALAAFFPSNAYVRLKAIPSAGSDWSDRLVHAYALDIAAAHRLPGAGAARARLLAVDVPSSYGHWVPPGVCYNDVGYYEVPNARVVYLEGGQVHSFGIASMISWRGEWYVVHLGAVTRNEDVGVVDEPASGRGTSAYSSTC